MDTQKTEGLTLYVKLSPQDADLLRAAVPTEITRDALGLKTMNTLAQTALGAICRGLLRQGYQPRPQSAEMRSDAPQGPEPLPPGVIKVQLT